MLSRPTGGTIAVKTRLEPTRTRREQRVHPGHDWFFVLEGRVVPNSAACTPRAGSPVRHATNAVPRRLDGPEVTGIPTGLGRRIQHLRTPEVPDATPGRPKTFSIGIC